MLVCGHDDHPDWRMSFPGIRFTGKTGICCQSTAFQQSGGSFILKCSFKKFFFIHKFLCCCRLSILSTFCWVIILYLHCSTNQEIVERKVFLRERMKSKKISKRTKLRRNYGGNFWMTFGAEQYALTCCGNDSIGIGYVMSSRLFHITTDQKMGKHKETFSVSRFLTLCVAWVLNIDIVIL